MIVPTAQEARKLCDCIRKALQQEINNAIEEGYNFATYTVCTEEARNDVFNDQREDFKRQAEILRDKGYHVTVTEEKMSGTVPLYGWTIRVRW